MVSLPDPPFDAGARADRTRSDGVLGSDRAVHPRGNGGRRDPAGRVACVACCGHGKGLYLIDRRVSLWRTGLFPPIPGRTSTLPSGTGTARRSGCGS